MGVITISRQYGSDGRTVGLRAAEAAGYLYIDKELIEEVAREAQVPVSEVERFDERPEHPALRVFRKFLTSGYGDPLIDLPDYEMWPPTTVSELATQRQPALSVLDEESILRLTREAILRLADRDKIVLMGRGSQALLADRSDVLHVRIVAPLEYRILIVMERDGLGREEAARQCQKVDEKRKRYIKRHYGVAWDDPKLYHLTINTEQTGVEAAAQIIVETARCLLV